MKKSILLFSACLIAGFSNAQQAQKSLVFKTSDVRTEQTPPSMVMAPINFNTGGVTTRHSGAKTTTTLDRWYDYVNEVLNNGVTGMGNTLAFSELPIWKDTGAIVGYGGTTPGYYSNEWTTLGLGFDPFAPVWNDLTVFPGVMAVTAADNYVIDSVAISAVYGRKAGTTYVDTLIISFVNGQGGTGTDNMPGSNFPVSTGLPTLYGIATPLNFINMQHDSVNNRAGNNPLITTATGNTATPLAYPSNAVYKFLLYPTDTMDGTFVSQLQGVYPRAATSLRPRATLDPVISYPVTAGHFSAMAVSFKSGGPFPIFPARDTIQYSGTGGLFKYGGYYPLVAYAELGTTAQFPPYGAGAGDWTSGYFKREGNDGNNWDGTYVPNWGWTVSGPAASTLQYPAIAFHATCTTCSLTSISLGTEIVTDLKNVTASPNPANDNLNISFTLAQGATASVSLTNMVGQVVATQNTTNGKTEFNTTALPSGLYIYSVQANGERTTGRVVIAH